MGVCSACSGRYCTRACQCTWVEALSHSKTPLCPPQVDRRLPAEAQERVRERMRRLAAARDMDAARCSRALAAAYHAVTRDSCLA